MSLLVYFGAFAAAVAVLVVRSHFKSVRRNAQYPPGPKGLPVVGNALQIPKEAVWDTFNEWSKEYGDVIGLENFGKPLIILNSLEAAQELFSKRAAIYSSRPHLTMAGDLVGFDGLLPLISFGDRFKLMRKFTSQGFHPKKIPEYFPQLEHHAGRLLRRLSHSPENFLLHLTNTIGGTLLSVVYGYQAKETDPYPVDLQEIPLTFSYAVAPGAWFVDVLPFLKYVPAWFPGADFQNTAKYWRSVLKKGLAIGDDVGRLEKEDGTPVQSFFSNTMFKDGKRLSPEDHDTLRWTAISLAGAGSFTGLSTLSFFLLEMAVHPDVQKRAQEEIDSVVGSDRLPKPSDKEKLPYTYGILEEIIRWIPIAPFGVPHTVIEDDYYNGMFIPKGTAIIPHQRAMMHDPRMFPEPHKFNPARYYSPEREKAEIPPIDPFYISLGFGRRQCPGINLAPTMLFNIIANVLATYEITRPIDKSTGKVYDPPVEAAPGNITFPVAFDVTIRPRSEKALALIESSTEPLL